MERITRFRHNVINVSAINIFEGIKGGINNDCKDVYFVRAIGINAAYLTDIQKLDDSLLSSMNNGRGYYHRLDCLPRMQSVEDTSFYTKCYDDWLDNGRKEILTRATGKIKALAGMLADACTTVEKLYKQDNKQVTDSMVKNFIVKLLFWYDSIFTDERFRFDEKQVMKIVAANVMKKQEYLFFYLVTLMGCDVLLLQSKGDISEQEEKLDLSTKFVLGDFSEIGIPAYQWHATAKEQYQRASSATAQAEQGQGTQTVPTQPASGQADTSASVNNNGRIIVKIPERNRPSRHPAQTETSTQTSGTQSNPQVTIPPRASGSSTNPQVTIPPRASGSSTNPQVTIPPRASGSSTNPQVTIPPRASGSSTNPKVTLPPRASGSSSNPQVTIPPRASGSSTNPKVTIPPRASGSSTNPQVTIPPRTSASPRASAPSVSTPARPAAAMSAGGDLAEKSFEELALLASSVVLITVYDGKGERLGSGSGIMIGKEGYILTNNHVASGGRCFSVRIEEDEQEYRTDEIIKYHSVLDLAIIRIQRKLSPIPVYKGSKPLVRGQKVVAIGSPLGLFNSVSNGIISGFRKINDVDMIQFTAPTSRGSSGGAVLNMQGEVIGISTAGIDAGQNINLAMGYECINMFIRGFI